MVVTHLFPGVYFLPSISQRTVYFPRGPFISQKGPFISQGAVYFPSLKLTSRGRLFPRGPFISQGGRLFPKSKNDK